MFSSNLTISAVSVELTTTTSLIIVLYNCLPIWEHFLDIPPITLGVLLVLYSLFPGSILSGLKHKYILSPTTRSLFFR